jgi:hypothetical protein
MIDLRERLIAALHAADCACNDTPTHFAAQYTPQADAALAVVASWLTDRARDLYYADGYYESYLAPGGALDLLAELAREAVKP